MEGRENQHRIQHLGILTPCSAERWSLSEQWASLAEGELGTLAVLGDAFSSEHASLEQ